MKSIEIPFEMFNCDVFNRWSKEWLLLTAGDYDSQDFNMMTVGWGALGIMWGVPFAMIVVRPHRFTLEFLEKYSDFTLCGFDEKYRPALEFCGSHSGRESCGKAREAGLTPMAATIAKAPIYKEAELVFECRKSFRSEMRPDQFIPLENAGKFYPEKDYHTIFFGEILTISGISKYIRK